MTAATPEGTGARSFGQIVAGLKPKKEFRSGQPVWRNSYTEGQLEDRLWRPIGVGRQRGTRRAGKRYAAVSIKMAKSFERRTRVARQKDQPGARNGALGLVGVQVLEALYEIVDFATGRLEPAIATIADMIGHSYSAIHEALVRLRTHGFLQWIRRSRPTENKGVAGPQVEQITNAYVLLLPKEFEDLARRLLGDSPAPDDADHARAEAQRDLKAMLDQLAATDFHKDFWAGDRLAGEQFGRIAALLDARDRQERESGRSGETGGSF